MNTTYCVAILIIATVGYVAFRMYSISVRDKALAEAHAAYQGSLVQLKQQPTNADLKQRTLELGRAYSNLTRSQKGVTIYDEMALGNDISAATAGASVAAAPIAAAAPPSASIEDRLKRLDELRTKGVINDQEYDARRQKILEDL